MENQQETKNKCFICNKTENLIKMKLKWNMNGVPTEIDIHKCENCIKFIETLGDEDDKKEIIIIAKCPNCFKETRGFLCDTVICKNCNKEFVLDNKRPETSIEFKQSAG